MTQALHLLRGHTDNVCALAPGVGPDTLISGSWDKTARVWVGSTCQHILAGHAFAVWDVLAVDPATLPSGAEGTEAWTLTASADKTIKLWRGATCTTTYRGHEDVVRGLVRLPAIAGFASCSNDASVRGWSMGGECLFVLHGHESFIYDLALLPTGELVSSGEDRSVKIWRGRRVCVCACA